MIERATDVLMDHLNRGIEAESFQPLVLGIRQVFAENGVSASRIQIPMTKLGGFRHPLYWAVILTWNEHNGFADTFIVTHEQRANSDEGKNEGSDETPVGPPAGSPFYELHSRSVDTYRVQLTDGTHGYPILNDLKEEGKVDYLAFSMPVPGSPVPQFISVASDAPFPEGFERTVGQLRGVFSLALYGAYRTSQSVQLARAYLGRRTGPKVLNGAIARGHTTVIHSGIMFCDIRGFTALSERLGGTEVVRIMNQLFEAIEDATTAQGGEILKFIGDAMLITFRLEDGSEPVAAQAMVRAVQNATVEVARTAERLGEDLSAGFGCHLGEVVYGNIGTPNRLDFTVMGPAVNLASRLESLTKTVGTLALFSKTVAAHIPELEPAGSHALKGISEPVTVYRLPESTSSA